MKFSCEKHLLQTAVAAASRAASAKSPISALEGLLIEAGAGVRVTGYDLKKGIYMNIEADVAQTGSAVLMTAKLFSEMMRLLPDGIVTVEVGDDSRASVVQLHGSARGRLSRTARSRRQRSYPHPSEGAPQHDRREHIRRLHKREPPGIHGQPL